MANDRDKTPFIDLTETPEGWKPQEGWQVVEDNRARVPAVRQRPVRDEIPAGTFHAAREPGGGDGGGV